MVGKYLIVDLNSELPQQGNVTDFPQWAADLVRPETEPFVGQGQGLPEIVQNFNAKNAWRFKPKKMLDDAGINCQLDLLAKRHTGPLLLF